MNLVDRKEQAMNVTPITLLEAVGSRVLHAGWQAAVLALCVVAVSWALGSRLPVRWRFALWLVVFARLAMPVVPSAPWSMFRLLPAWSDGPNPSQRPVLDVAEHMDRPVAQSVVRPVVVTAPVIAEASAEERVPEEPILETTLSLSPAQWLAVIWLAGALLLLLRRAWLGLRLARQRRSWRPVVDPIVCATLAECQSALRMTRRVELFCVPGPYGPATCGVFRPRILLPETLGRLFSPKELRLVLMHELMHVRRWDVLTDHAAAFLTAVHWFNPVAWLALARLRRERELACDAAVLDFAGPAEAGLYGRAFLKIVEFIQTPKLVPGAVGMSGRDLALARRIYMIASYRKPSTAAVLLGGALLFLLAASGWTDAGPMEPLAEQASAGAEAGDEAAPGKTITITGVCRDEAGKPLPGVRVVVYREDFYHLKTDRLQELATDAAGKFRFAGLPAMPRGDERVEWYYAVVVTAKGRASTIRRLSAGEPADQLTINMPPAATLRGRVTDQAGKPISGALVWFNGLLESPLEGVLSARTDQDGRYAVTDLHAWDCTKQQPTPTGDGAVTMCTGCYFSVRHPDFGHQRPLYRRVPDTINVALQPAGVIEGRVIDQPTGKPAGGVLVWLQGTNDSDNAASGQTRTDGEGQYRLTSLVAAKYNVFADAPDRACAALDSFAVQAGTTREAPDLLLVEGGWIEGRLVDAESGKAISGGRQGERLDVAVYGPSRPKSGAACLGSRVDNHGGFRLHVAPGLNFPYIMVSDVWNRTQRREFYEKGVEVKSGEVVRLTFRVLPKKPPRDPEAAPARLAVPVAAEREAATAIRQLGGWYRVDKDNHVIKVNMVYHETPEKARYDNDRTDTDEALRTVSAFPRLQELYLHKGQATDEGLKTLAALKNLKTLYIWDAEHVTDTGTRHLANLTTLQDVHINNGKIGDPSLEVFSRLPKLCLLSLQGNSFSDDGLKHLARMKQLRVLWVGMSRLSITDAGVAALSGLTALEELDLQGGPVSDAGVAALKPLKQLRTLYLAGDREGGASRITDASIETLLGFAKLQYLGVQNTWMTADGIRRLVELPALKDLSLSSRSLPDGLRDELQKRRPELKLYLTSLGRE
jgi:beta-lactamase regulating signal transducer with metallopeptidase domain/protocatechuate 3,4-dioxygenase beta subunit